MAAALRFAQRLFSCALLHQGKFIQIHRRIGPHVLDNVQKYEEESLPWYTPEIFYSVRMWEVFNKRYQVVGKLGRGAYSTVWLCRDLKYVLLSGRLVQCSQGFSEHNYVLIKVSECNSSEAEREREVYKLLNSITTSHDGARCVRQLLDTFETTTAAGSHISWFTKL
jgi:serine/threonine protein kinase